MAIACPGIGVGLTRSASHLDPAQDWTRAGWYRVTPLPTGSYTTFRLIGDPSYMPPWIWIGVEPDRIAAQIDPGSGEVDAVSSDVIIAGTWYYIAVRYLASAKQYELLVNAASTGFPATVDLSGLTPQPTEYAGTDTDGFAGSTLDSLRDWQAWLSEAELSAEMASRIAVRTDNLLADTPVVAVDALCDLTGNGHDWTAIGGITQIAGPFTEPTGQVCACFNCRIGPPPVGGGSDCAVTPLSFLVDHNLSAQVGVSFGVALLPTGGTGPYTITVLAGSTVAGVPPASVLPPGLDIIDQTLGGVPTAVGVYPVTFKVVDPDGNEGLIDCVITVSAAPGPPPTIAHVT